MTELRRLLGLFGAHRGWLVLGILLALVTLLANIGLMALSGWFIAAMALAGSSGSSFNYFTPAAGIRGLAIGRTVGRYLERLVTHEATFRVLATLRVWFYTRLEPLAPAGLQYARSGDLLHRIRADIDTLDNAYLRILLPIVAGLAGSLLVTAFIAWWAPGTGVVTGGLLATAGILLPWWVRRRARSVGERLVTTRARLRTTVVDGLSGMGELAVFGAGGEQARAIDALGHDLVRDQRRMSRLAGLSQAAVGLCANLALWGSLVVAIPAVTGGALRPAELAMIALLVLAAFEAVMPVPMAFQVLDETLAAARRLFALADQAPPVAEPPEPAAPPAGSHVRIENVSLGYHPEQAPALEDFTLDLAPGRRVALLGPTGAGKTSVTQLLLKFAMPSAGRLTLDGVDYLGLDGETIRQRFAVAAQHAHLFNTTIGDNLRIANPEATPAALEAACKLAQIHAFIAAQPDGYDTGVGEAGLKLSGGQVRRLAVARALLKDAPVLVLDEPGEGLDPPTEQAMLRAVIGHVANRRSLLMITHRPTGLDAMDEIMVLDRGRVIDRGRHDELLRRSTFYQRLCSRFDS